MNHWTFVYFILLFSSHFLLAVHDSNFLNLSQNKKLDVRPYFEITYGKEIGVDHSYSTLGVLTSFTPRLSPKLLLYSDIRWYDSLDKIHGASIEGGVFWRKRHQTFGGCIDYHWRHHHSNFNQISMGLWAIIESWAFNLNAYFPLENQIKICHSVFSFEEGFRATFKTYDVTYRFITMNIARFFNLFPQFGITIGIEPYYLTSGSKQTFSNSQSSWGGKARILLELFEAIKIEGSLSQDRIFHTRAQILIGIDILQLFSNKFSKKTSLPLYRFRRQGLIAIKNIESWCFNW